MALSKIIAEGVDLTDTFAFTGTVTGAGSGGLVLIGSSVATADVAQLDVLGLDQTYKNLFITGHLINAGDGVSTYMRVFDTNDTIISSASYDWSRMKYNNVTTAGAKAMADNQWDLTAKVGSDVDEKGVSFRINMTNIGIDNAQTHILSQTGYEEETGNFEGGLSCGSLTSQTQDINGIRLFMSSGNLETGSYVNVYGVVDS